jgi:hypothetical protein
VDAKKGWVLRSILSRIAKRALRILREASEKPDLNDTTNRRDNRSEVTIKKCIRNFEKVNAD